MNQEQTNKKTFLIIAALAIFILGGAIGFLLLHDRASGNKEAGSSADQSTGFLDRLSLFSDDGDDEEKLRQMQADLAGNYWLEHSKGSKNREEALEAINRRAEMDAIKLKIEQETATDAEKAEYYRFMKKITRDRIDLINYHLKLARENPDQENYSLEDLDRAEQEISELKEKMADYESRIP